MKKLTEEQKAKAQARREKFRALWKEIAAMTDAQRMELLNKFGAIVTCEGHPLSMHNTLLVISQSQTVSVVGGFRQWLKHGRCVRKGEHGLMIWCPTGSKKDGETPSNQGAANDIFSDAKPGQASEPDDRRFIVGTVFDIAQTDELPKESDNVTVDGVTVLEVAAA